LCYILRRPPPTSAPLPYTTLFRSHSSTARRRRGTPPSSTMAGRLTLRWAARRSSTAVRRATPILPITAPPAALPGAAVRGSSVRSEEHTSELQSHLNLVCRLLLEK